MVRTAGGITFVLQAPWRGRPHRDPGRTRARRESRRRLRRSAPSLGANGRRNEWIVSWIVSPEEADPADPPEWLMQLLQRPRRNGAAPPVGKKISPGRRNQELTSVAGTMRRRGMEEDEILAALRTNERRCDPPLEVVEVEKIAASVARYEPASDVVHVSFNGHGSARPPRGYNLTDLG